MRLGRGFLFGAAALVAGVVSACAVSETRSVADGYQIFQTERLDGDAARSGEMLQILEDSRITPGLRKNMWGGFNEPEQSLEDLGVGKDDPAYVSFKRTPVRPAAVRLLDAAGRVVDSRLFDVPLAEIQDRVNLPGRRTAFAVTADHSIGMGSYAGRVTHFVVVADGKLRWQQEVDAGTGERREMIVGRAVKSDWTIEKGDASDDILGVASGPNLAKPDWAKTGEFLVTYYRLRFDGTSWRRTERSEVGFWENEDDFPETAKFPPADAR